MKKLIILQKYFRKFINLYLPLYEFHSSYYKNLSIRVIEKYLIISCRIFHFPPKFHHSKIQTRKAYSIIPPYIIIYEFKRWRMTPFVFNEFQHFNLKLQQEIRVGRGVRNNTNSMIKWCSQLRNLCFIKTTVALFTINITRAFDLSIDYIKVVSRKLYAFTE